MAVDIEFLQTETRFGYELARGSGRLPEFSEERVGVAEFPVQLAARCAAHEVDDLMWILDRKRLPERGVEKCEDGRVGADSECH